MNIFATSANPTQCAREHCTVHTIKQILEYAQILSTAHRVLDGDEYANASGLYRKTHHNHPSTVWSRQSAANYKWLYRLWFELLNQYSAATGKQHATSRLIDPLRQVPVGIPNAGLTDLPLVTGGHSSYTDYLNAKFKEWQSRLRPIRVEWYNETPEWVDTIATA